jgi:hypothetical protein
VPIAATAVGTAGLLVTVGLARSRERGRPEE